MKYNFLWILIFVCITAQFNAAYAYCSDPGDRIPSCTEQLFEDKFKDSMDFEMCKSSIKRYTNELEDWVRCTQDEAVERSNKAVKKFNCKANGERFC